MFKNNFFDARIIFGNSIKYNPIANYSGNPDILQGVKAHTTAKVKKNRKYNPIANYSGNPDILQGVKAHTTAKVKKNRKFFYVISQAGNRKNFAIQLKCAKKYVPLSVNRNRIRRVFKEALAKHAIYPFSNEIIESSAICSFTLKKDILGAKFAYLTDHVNQFICLLANNSSNKNSRSSTKISPIR